MNADTQRAVERLWKKIKQFRFIFNICPFVKMVAVCNSLARDEAKFTSDIDLFIVTKEGRLYTARFFMKILSQMFFMRVHHKKIAGRFCLSFFVSENALDLSGLAHEYDPHLANFVKVMKPVYGHDMYIKFLDSNQKWTRSYFSDLPNHSRYIYSYSLIGKLFKHMFERVINICGNAFEKWVRNYQISKDELRKNKLLNAQEKKLSVILEEDIFKFHESDPREEIERAHLSQRAKIQV